MLSLFGVIFMLVIALVLVVMLLIFVFSLCLSIRDYSDIEKKADDGGSH